MIETQATIRAWVTETFGEAGSNFRVAARANEEMAELLRALSADSMSMAAAPERNRKAAEEAADVAIVLYRLADRLGGNVSGNVDRLREDSSGYWAYFKLARYESSGYSSERPNSPGVG